jgi:uncharacterized membrane protein
MAWALRAGLLLSLVLLAGGIALYAILHPGATSQGVLATNPIAGFLSFGGLAHGLVRGSPEAILTLGILVLVATPIVRVASGFYYFERSRERTMSLVTLTVLLLLLFGLLVFGPLVR